MMDLADRIREYGKEKELEPMGYGESFAGAPVEKVVKSGFKGRLRDSDGRMVRVKT